jgi:pSer/pThr/pTyr-binding forkhead associated (FHA) protein
VSSQYEIALIIDGQAIAVPPGSAMILGRDPGHSHVADVFSRYPNISRRHAHVGATPDGQVWIRDNFSANGTYVNGEPIEPGREVELRDNDVIRLAADATVRVQIDPRLV